MKPLTATQTSTIATASLALIAALRPTNTTIVLAIISTALTATTYRQDSRK